MMVYFYSLKNRSQSEWEQIAEKAMRLLSRDIHREVQLPNVKSVKLISAPFDMPVSLKTVSENDCSRKCHAVAEESEDRFICYDDQIFSCDTLENLDGQDVYISKLYGMEAEK